MTETIAPKPAVSTHRSGVLLVLASVAAVAMLAMHPGEPASHALADVLRAEAANAVADAVVHGGFVLVLALQVSGLAVLGLAIARQKPLAIIAFCLALFGAGLLSASMVADGFMTPAVAARYLAAPAAAQDQARVALALIGAAVGALMPLGLIFQGLSTLAWGAVLTPLGGRARLGGLAAMILAPGMLIGAVLGLAGQGAAPLIGALLSLIAWILAAGLTLAVWRAPGEALGH